MEIDSNKICEYLRVYLIILSRALCFNKPMYECFKKMIENNETTLGLDEFDNMLLIKNYYSASMLLFSAKDSMQKGLNDIDLLKEGKVFDIETPINKTCMENFTDKDIIIYIRNAIAHNKNNLSSIFIDESNLKIKIKLQNTIASKGVNKGKNVPFEIELDNNDLLRISTYCLRVSRTINISGVDFNREVVANSSTKNIFKLLKKVVYSTYYTYTLFKTINDQDKKKLYESHYDGNTQRDMRKFDSLKTKFVRKDERVELSDHQKKCMCHNLKESLNQQLESINENALTLKNSKSNREIRTILGTFMGQYYEYEALKVIPMGKEKKNNHVISMLLNLYNKKNEDIVAIQIKLVNELYKKGVAYSFFEAYNIVDPEEFTMFINNIFDDPYITREAASIYYNYVFETIIPEGEIVTINNTQYEADRIRNAFTHGRWYFDMENISWVLFDNNNSLKKPDQYSFDWKVIIPDKALYEFVEQQYQNAISNSRGV